MALLVHRDLCFEDVLVGGLLRDAPANHLGQFLFTCMGWMESLCTQMGLLVAFLKGLCRAQACLQVEDHIQEVGYFDNDLGVFTQVLLRIN